MPSKYYETSLQGRLYPQKTWALSPVLLGILLLALSFWMPTSAWAHAVFIYGWEEGDRICTDSYFSKRQKVQKGSVSLRDLDGSILAQGAPDTTGSWCTQTVSGYAEVILEVDAGEGHKGKYHLELAQKILPATTETPSPVFSTGANAASAEPFASATSTAVPQQELQILLRQAVKEELAPIQRTLTLMHQEAQEPSMVAIIGGIGWLIGVCGLGAFLLGKRK